MERIKCEALQLIIDGRCNCAMKYNDMPSSGQTQLCGLQPTLMYAVCLIQFYSLKIA